MEAARRGIALLEEGRSGERWRAHWPLGAALAASDEAEAGAESLRRAVALLGAMRDDLPEDDLARRAGVTRARSGPARALVEVLRALGRDAEADDVAGKWTM